MNTTLILISDVLLHSINFPSDPDVTIFTFIVVISLLQKNSVFLFRLFLPCLPTDAKSFSVNPIHVQYHTIYASYEGFNVTSHCLIL